MQPHLVILVAVGGAVAFLVLWRGVSEVLNTEAPSARWTWAAAVLVYVTAFWIIFRDLADVWPEAKMPFLAIWFGPFLLFGLWRAIRKWRDNHS
jgi:hypothetical protein